MAKGKCVNLLSCMNQGRCTTSTCDSDTEILMKECLVGSENSPQRSCGPDIVV